jgi:hypothetical protein
MLKFLQALFEPELTARHFFALVDTHFKFLEDTYKFILDESHVTKGVGYAISYIGKLRSVAVSLDFRGYEVNVLLSAYPGDGTDSQHGANGFYASIELMLECQSTGLSSVLPGFRPGLPVACAVDKMLDVRAQYLRKYGEGFLSGDEQIIHRMKECQATCE